MAYSPMDFDNRAREITEEEAIHCARIELGLDESAKGRAWRVRRLDNPTCAYHLVQLGDWDAVVAVATVDTSTGEVGVRVSLPGLGPHMAVDAQLAIELAALGETAQAELVWMPCSASKSPLYPFWEVRSPGKIRYVDQRGKVLERLEPARPGG